MHVEERRTFPVALKKAWDFTNEFRRWPDWYVGVSDLLDPATSAWDLPGDEVRFVYRLLGRRLEGVTRLEERIEHDLARFRSEIPGIPTTVQTWRWIDGGDHCEVVVTMEAEDTTRFFEKMIEKTLLPRTLRRDLRESLENLSAIFEADTVD
jgi:hypothetical protein